MMLSLYVHIPFCVSKCPYCGFYSTLYDEKKGNQFLSGIRQEIEQKRPLIERYTIGTIYLGGGTPTCLSQEQMESLFSLLSDKNNVRVSPKTEMTVEANPCSASDQKLSLLQSLGVNRISIGVQSFSDPLLSVLGRVHTAREAASSVLRAQRAGFGNIGIDLIYGIPGQTTSLWRKTVERAIDLEPEHISSYCLSLDDRSMFHRMAAEDAFNLPDDETTADMYELAVHRFGGAGYVQYELSNFAKPGFECQHNNNYWDRGEYIGLGPGAWTFLGEKRSCNVDDLTEYLRRLAAGLPIISLEDVLTADDAARESLLLGLRTTKGVDLGSFRRSFGRKAYEGLIRGLELSHVKRFAGISNGRLCLTSTGKILADEAVRLLCP